MFAQLCRSLLDNIKLEISCGLQIFIVGILSAHESQTSRTTNENPPAEISIASNLCQERKVDFHTHTLKRNKKTLHKFIDINLNLGRNLLFWRLDLC